MSHTNEGVEDTVADPHMFYASYCMNSFPILSKYFSNILLCPVINQQVSSYD